jgi:4-amino-4-deoxy-L-arabinose transferase-like glycosyltransferase
MTSLVSSQDSGKNLNRNATTGAACSPWDRTDWNLIAALALAAGLAFIVCLGAFGILDPSDGYYSEGAREMFESGNWLVPHLNYAYFFDKPIMNYWLIASSYRAFGVTEFASRIPAAICGALLIPGMYAFSRQFLRRRGSLFAALALLSSPMWLTLGHMSLTDMPLSFFIWVALGSFFVALERNRNGLVWLGYIALGCGLLTKGPLALFLVAMNLGVYILIKRPSISELWSLILRLQVIPGLLLSFAIAAPWYLMVNAETKGVFFQEFFLNQNINRAMGTVDHKAGPLYYIPVLIGSAFPWTIAALMAPRLWFSPWLVYLKQSFSRNLRKDSLETTEEVTNSRYVPLNFRCIAFGVSTALATSVFFSILPTKLVTYLLPVVPSLALIAGYALDKLLRSSAAKASMTFLSCMTTLLGGVATAVLIYSLNGGNFAFLKGKEGLVLKEMLVGDLLPRSFLCGSFTVMLIGGIAAFVLVRSGKLRNAVTFFVASVVLSIVIAVPASVILSYQQKCRDMQKLVLYARSNGISPVMLGRRNPSATFYLGSKVKFLGGPSDLLKLLQEEKATNVRSYFLVQQVAFDDLKLPEREKFLVKQDGDWILGRNQ